MSAFPLDCNSDLERNRGGIFHFPSARYAITRYPDDLTIAFEYGYCVALIHRHLFVNEDILKLL